MKDTLLHVKDLFVDLYSPEGIVHAVSGVNLDIQKGETAGLVGESGCGKSVTARSIMRLLPRNIVRYGEDSHIEFNGKSLLALSDHDMRLVRGREISMVFQDPMTSLNPVKKVSSQILEGIYLHRSISKRREARDLAFEMLSKVGFVDPGRVLDCYPHELSGGMCQRVVIAMALCCNSLLLIADEPTTALDVTVQREILELISGLSKEYRMSVLLITHDFGVVAKLCDRVNVMYAGQLVEKGGVLSIFEGALHPYTEGLIASLLDIEKPVKTYRGIPGTVPNLMAPPAGCRFHSRCSKKMKRCEGETPPETNLGEDHFVCCWLYDRNGRRNGEGG
ncbi:MAG: ABC transporter ATP-binding protein [Deltaproteobacteria bacterium]